MKAKLAALFGMVRANATWADATVARSLLGAAAFNDAEGAPLRIDGAGWRASLAEQRFAASTLEKHLRLPLRPNQIMVDEPLGVEALVAEPMG